MINNARFTAPNGDSFLLSPDWVVGHTVKGNKIERIPTAAIRSVRVDRERFFFAIEYICRFETFNGVSHSLTFKSKSDANDMLQAIRNLIEPKSESYPPPVASM